MQDTAKVNEKNIERFSGYAGEDKMIVNQNNIPINSMITINHILLTTAII
jgi:hypothetical protein